MADYIYIDDYLKRGKLAISSQVFNFLANQALKEIPAVRALSKKKGKADQIINPIETNIRHGIVHVNVTIDAKKGTNIKETSKLIQNEINNAFMICTEQIPFDVSVKVVSLI